MSDRARRTRTTVRLGVAALMATVLGGCAGDELDKAEFVRLTTDADTGLSRAVAECVYDSLAKDDAVLAELSDKGPRSDELTEATDKKMQSWLAECILAGDSTGGTGGAGSTTTTRRSGR